MDEVEDRVKTGVVDGIAASSLQAGGATASAPAGSVGETGADSIVHFMAPFYDSMSTPLNQVDLLREGRPGRRGLPGLRGRSPRLVLAEGFRRYVHRRMSVLF